MPCDLSAMALDRDHPPTEDRRARMSGTDAALLTATIFGILTGLSLVRFEIAVVVGLALLTYVAVKLLTTKVK